MTVWMDGRVSGWVLKVVTEGVLKVVTENVCETERGGCVWVRGGCDRCRVSGCNRRRDRGRASGCVRKRKSMGGCASEGRRRRGADGDVRMA